MFERLMRKLEDPARPLLGPNVKGLRLCGVLHSNNLREKYIKLFLNSVVFVFILTECVDIYMIRDDMELVLLNLQLSMCATISGFKVLTMYIWQSRWRAVLEYATKADLGQRASGDRANLAIVNKSTRYCRKVTYTYWALTFVTGMNTILQPAAKFMSRPAYRHDVISGSIDAVQVIRSWVPWDKRNFKGYVAASIYQSYSALIGMAWISTIDSCAIVILVFFRVELQLLRNDCRNIFGTEQAAVDDDECLRRIRDCHRRYIDILKYSRIYNSCMSPVMLFYMFVCTIMLCSTTYLLTEETSIFKGLLLADQLVFGLLQLFLFCWHSNDVTFANKDVMQGPYESQWWCAPALRRREICVLIHLFQTPIVFTAGPFTDLTAATFINIIKAAYSYVTILKQSKN